MTLKTKAMLFSAFICPGIGQVQVGKRWGYLFIAAVVIILVFIFASIMVIVTQEMNPEMMMRLSPVEFAHVFVEVRRRVYHEDIPAFALLLIIWLASIIDIAIWKPKEDNPTNP